MRSLPFRRRLPRSSLMAFALAAACATTAFTLVAAQAARIQAMAPPPRVIVVTAARDLPAGAVLTAVDLALTPTFWAPPAAIGAIAQAEGQTLVAPIAAGEPLTRTRLATSALAGAVAPGRLVVRIAVASVPVGVAPADRIDVFATFAGARPYTTLVGSDLRVIAAMAGDAGLDGAPVTTLTLDVDGETARLLLGAEASATLSAAVRAPSTWSLPSATPSPSVTASAPPEGG